MITSLLIMGDSIYSHTNPFFGLAGIANDPDDDVPVKTGLVSDTATGLRNRLPFIRRASNPPLMLVNGANPGTKLGSGDYSGEWYAPVGIDPLLRPAVAGTDPRLYILFMAYSNRTDTLPADAAARYLTFFNARFDAAEEAGVDLACMTATLISRTGAGGFTEVARHEFNDDYLRNSSWRGNSGRPIYVADYAGIASLDDTDAADGWGTDGIHPTDETLQLMIPPLRTTINQIIADYS